MTLQRIRAVFYRGGTSKALLFREKDLPVGRDARDAIFLAAMGVPDPNGRNLDGMGGGLSSLNKICVVGAPTHPAADVDFTFVQLSPDSDVVDYGGNCGNMSSAIGPFAIEEGLVPAPAGSEAAVTIHNTNTGKLIRARFPVEGNALAAEGDLAIDGVAGTAAPIRLEFLEPGGAKTGKLLPTGNAVDRFDIQGLGVIEASCIDAANPAVFVRATDLGMTGTELPQDLEQNTEFLARMESIRGAAADAMGIACMASVPKVAMVVAPADAPTLSGRLGTAEHDIAVRMISVGQPHRAVPITGAVCLAVAARVAGSIPQQLCTSQQGAIRIGHPSGTLLVEAEVANGPSGFRAEWGAVYRTARRLFEGAVVYRFRHGD